MPQNLTSMFHAAAAAAAASGGGHRGGTRFPANLFNTKRPSGLESPPASLDNRSTPGSLDLSHRDRIDRIDRDDYMESMESMDDAPPTMVKMEAMVYPKIDSEDEEEHTRLEKRVFPLSEDNSEDAQDLSAAKKMKLESVEAHEAEPQNNNSSDENTTKLVTNNPNNETESIRVREDLKTEHESPSNS